MVPGLPKTLRESFAGAATSLNAVWTPVVPSNALFLATVDGWLGTALFDGAQFELGIIRCVEPCCIW